MLTCSSAYAASFGHSRMVSGLGQPLRIELPITQLSAQDNDTLQVSAAPASAWMQAGLTPPVDLASMQFRLVDGASPNSKVVQISSTESFDKPVADLLLNVRTATGQRPYQVSLLTAAKAKTIGASPVSVSQGGPSARSSAAAKTPVGAQASSGSVRVKRGDTLFSIARRHAVANVSVYQMMLALQRANPQAFINDNINLVKAGAVLDMPDAAALTAVSDTEARRLFQQQAQTFAAYRQGIAASSIKAVQGKTTAAGPLSQAAPGSAAPAVPKPRDQVVLSNSSSSADNAADDRLATRENIADSQERVSQLEQNVKSLNQALQSQGQAAVAGAQSIGQSIADVASAISDNSSPAGNAAAPGVAQPSGSASSSADAKTPGPAAGSAASPAAAASPVENSSTLVSNKAEQSVSWFQENLLAVVTGLLALIVLIIAWVLRRVNSSRDDDYQGTPVTEAMVNEQLEKINLDLRQAPSDAPSDRVPPAPKS